MKLAKKKVLIIFAFYKSAIEGYEQVIKIKK